MADGACFGSDRLGQWDQVFDVLRQKRRSVVMLTMVEGIVRSEGASEPSCSTEHHSAGRGLRHSVDDSDARLLQDTGSLMKNMFLFRMRP